MREAASRGFWVASRTPYGYNRVMVQDGAKKRPMLEPDPDASEVVKRIFDMAEAGTGMLQISKTLNDEGIASPAGKLWSKNGVHFILRNEVYTGTLVWGTSGKGKDDPVRVEKAFPAIVSRSDTASPVVPGRSNSPFHSRCSVSTSTGWERSSRPWQAPFFLQDHRIWGPSRGSTTCRAASGYASNSTSQEYRRVSSRLCDRHESSRFCQSLVGEVVALLHANVELGLQSDGPVCQVQDDWPKHKNKKFSGQ